MIPAPIDLGGVSIEVPLMLAPMAGMSDLPFRETARRCGAGYAVAEMTSSKPELWDTKKSATRWSDSRESGIRVVQLLGADPEMMALAASRAEQLGAQVVDVNMGCPAKKVVGRECGSALMRDIGLVREILSATAAATSLPVTLKIRTGWDDEHKNALEVARIARDCGIRMLVVHGRTRSQGFKGSAEYGTIAEVKRCVDLPVIANGDVDSGEKALRVLEQTGADGLMIGRASYGNPWIFREILCALSGETFTAPDADELERVMLYHAALQFECYEEGDALRKIRRHVISYLNKFARRELEKSFFERIFAAKNKEEFIELVKISIRNI